MTDFIIRDARSSDYDAMLDVTFAAYEEYSTMMPTWAWEEYRHGMVDTIRGEIPVERIVAEQGDAIVGSVLLYPEGTVFEIPDGPTITLAWPEVRLLAVKPEARGQGIGLALTKECVRRARRNGASAVTLHTTDMMQTAMSMYERMGFVRAPELDFIPAEDVVIKGYRYNLEGVD